MKNFINNFTYLQQKHHLMASSNPYPSITALKEKNKRSWFSKKIGEENNHKWYIEEKIDGSQLSVFLDENEHKLKFYNKNTEVCPTNYAFSKAISMLSQNKIINSLNPDYIYHGESVRQNRHNVIRYETTPKYYFIVYDIFKISDKSYLSREDKEEECKRLSFACVPVLYFNDIAEINPYDKCHELIQMIEKEELHSCLGGPIEGVVLKHHAYVSKGKKIATKLKCVTDTFKERHKTKQCSNDYSADEYLEKLGKSFNTEARFQKAYQHLREKNKLTDELKQSDTDKIIEELNDDFDKEYKDELTLLLWTEFSPIIKKYSCQGIGNWIKKKIDESKI